MTDITTIEPDQIKRRKLDGLQCDRLQCEFFIPKKNRYCSMSRRSDSKFCAEHSSNTVQDRVICPLDPSHSVWKRNLGKHLKKCNAKKDSVVRECCFEEDVNAGVKSDDVGKISIHDDKEKFIEFINDLVLKYDELIAGELPLEDDFDEEDSLKSRFDELTNKKHIIQQSSMISHLKNKLISPEPTLVLEFGCGKLELSRYINKFLNSHDKLLDYLLIDRASPRLKYDTKFIKDFQEHNEKEFTTMIRRYKIDIKDLQLDNAIERDFQDDTNYIAVSKHLCGVATDLTLRCCLNSKQFNLNKGSIMIAMCCRHVCSYDQLLDESREYLSRFNIDKFKFNNYLVKLSSWATCGKRDNEDSDDHFTDLKYDQRLQIGLKARRIIDESRKYAMEQNGYHVKICKYVTHEISLENHLMICTHE